jgi:cell division protein FtsN
MDLGEQKTEAPELDPLDSDSAPYAFQETAGSLNIWHLILIFFGGIGVCVLFFALGFLIGKNQGKMEQMISSKPTDSRISSDSLSRLNPTGGSLQETAAAGTADSKAGTQNKLDFYSEVNRNFKTETPAQEMPSGTPSSQDRPKEENKVVASAAEPTTTEPAIVSAPEPTLAEAPSTTLGQAPAPAPAPAGPTGESYRVQVGAFRTQEESQNLVVDLEKKGFDSFIEPPGGRTDNLFRVQMGPYTSRAGALEVISRLKKSGMSSMLKKY